MAPRAVLPRRAAPHHLAPSRRSLPRWLSVALAPAGPGPCKGTSLVVWHMNPGMLSGRPRACRRVVPNVRACPQPASEKIFEAPSQAPVPSRGTGRSHWASATSDRHYVRSSSRVLGYLGHVFRMDADRTPSLLQRCWVVESRWMPVTSSLQVKPRSFTIPLPVYRSCLAKWAQPP
jgi:hypothetical protein